MAKLETYGAGYGGLLSNSMLQAAIVCPVKYELMYRDGIRPDKDGIWFNMAFAGNILHRCIELHDDDHAAIEKELWDILESYFGDRLVIRTQRIMAAFKDACEATQRDGARWGKTYKAPEMTSFFKKNYGGILEKLSALNEDAQAYIDGAVFEEPWIDLIKKMFVSINNWKEMRLADPVAVEILLSGVVGPADASTHMVGTADRLERRPAGKIALTDFKTGKWEYDYSDVANSDQFYLYHRLLEQSEYGPPVEWTVYNLLTGNTVTVIPNEAILEKGANRLATNLRYFRQLEQMFDKAEVPTPAGSHFKTGCPCILAKTGDCPYVYEG